MRSIGSGVPRNSVRSYESSTSTTISVDPREKIKDCCRKLVAFMCTQVGVGGLIVCYAILGAFCFMRIETERENPQLAVVEATRNTTVNSLWNRTLHLNIFEHVTWKADVDVILKEYQGKIVGAIKNGYDGRKAKDIWSFPAALMFCMSVFTMIGYGNVVPRTGLGRGMTVLYAVFGIPLYVLYFMNMGNILAGSFRWLYTRCYECSTPDPTLEGGDPPRQRRRIIVPSTACLWVIAFYIMVGSIMFATWENWNYLDSTYFCVTSLCKLGIGDFVPGANIMAAKDGDQTKLVINFVYMLLGMGLIAMCYNLMREEIRVKMREMREDLAQCMEDVRIRMVSCSSSNADQ